ncbi:MAG: hypothetical protein Q8L35_08420 [Actinomycetota bacterium]|nr:hypothetical protein [Actinomycetota bacterium]
MPGADTYAAEGIYEPSGDEIMIKMPLNVYVAITYHITAASAQKSIEKQLLMSYPKDQVEIPLKNRVAKSGLDSEKGSYMIAWTENGYSIEVNGSFIQYVPEHQEATLQKTTLAVAEKVADQVQTVLGKAK